MRRLIFVIVVAGLLVGVIRDRDSKFSGAFDEVLRTRLALKLLAHLAVWLAHSVLAGHRPPSA